MACRLPARLARALPRRGEGGISSERDRRSRRAVTQRHIVRDKSQQRGPVGERLRPGFIGEAHAQYVLCAASGSKANAQARSEERASTVAIGRAFMPSAERSETISAGSRSLPCLHQTRHAPACERSEHHRGLSPVASGSGTERSEAAVRRCGSPVAAQRSGVKRTETPESGSPRGGSLRMSVRSNAPEQSRSAVCRRPHGSRGPRSAACAVAGTRRSTRRLTCQRSESGIGCRAREPTPNTLCPLRRRAGLTAVRKTGLPWAKL